jgi:hypothetical protein
VFSHSGRVWRGAPIDPVRAQNFRTNVWEPAKHKGLTKSTGPMT